MGPETNRQKETQVKNVKNVFYLLWTFSYKIQVQKTPIKSGPPVVCLNGVGNFDGVGRGREGCPLTLNQRSVETLWHR